MKNSESIAARFSSAVDTYDQSVDIQPIVAAKVAAMTGTLPTPSTILDWGCGTGNLSACLHKVFPEAAISALDISEMMVETAQAKHGEWLNKCIAGDIRSIKELQDFSVIASSSSLHWIRPLSSALGAAYKHLKVDGHLVFGMMLKGTLKELMDCRKDVAPTKPVNQPMPNLDDVVNALTLNGFTVVEQIVEKSKTEHASSAQLLKALHDQGVTGGHFTTPQNLLNRSELIALKEKYDSSYRTSHDKVYATYKVLYIVAAKS